ncbi:MAG: CHAT domain-containing protein [Saprospiraceae bacterium]|nr:CHAT domain-containing protein [Saprospiraceae bacterium]
MRIINSILLLFIPILVLCQQGASDLTGNIKRAQDLEHQKKYQEALDVLEKLDIADPGYSLREKTTLLELSGNCYTRLQQYDNAIKAYTSGTRITEGNDTLRAIFENKLGLACYYQSQYNTATEHILISRDLFQQLYGVESKQYIGTLNTLGFFYNIQAKYSEAEKTFLEAQQINLQLTGGTDIQYARIINNLADVYTSLNRYDQADELYQTSLRIKDQLSGKESIDYAKTLFNLADFQASLGRNEKAKSLIEEGIAIYQKIKETDHPQYLKFLDYQAILIEQLGDTEQAENLYLKTLQIRENKGATQQDDYALNLINLGQLYVNQSQPDKGYPFIEKALPLTATIYGEAHPNYASALTLMATILAKQGKKEQAKENYQKAIRIIQRALGKDHIQAFHAQFAYARFLQQNGNRKEAIALYRKIDQIPKDYLKRATRFLSEKELNEKVEEYRLFSREIYSLLRSEPDNPELTALAYNTTLFYRGYIMGNLQRIRQGLLKARKVSDARDEVISLHRQLENQLNLPVDQRGDTRDLERQIEDLESQISRTLGSFQAEDKDVDWEAVQLALGHDEAAVEYLAFPDPEHEDSIYYGALVLDEFADAPAYIGLCAESELAHLFPTNAIRQADYISLLYDFSNRGLQPAGEKQTPLVDLIWKPIQQHIQDSKRVYIVPDGFLHRVAIAALPTSLETVVSDSFELVLYASTRQVVPQNNRIMAYSEKTSFIVGGVQFDGGAPNELASRSKDLTQKWSFLPWAEKESQSVSEQLQAAGYKVNMLSGLDADEQHVKQTMEDPAGWRIIHFATHGYFHADTAAPVEAEGSFYGKGMMNSGLVLASVNRLQMQAHQSFNDGLLSAYEVSRMDLSKTELVVLSACETALGDIKDEEGVYGLQRAFKLAGADKMIMSLWQVPDRETKDFMVTFYTNWLHDKSSIRVAFQKTQHEFRQRFFNPHQWAGFILLE